MAENTVPIFNGGNYDSWRIKMRAYLMSQGMWDLVENGYHHLKTEEAKEIQKKKDGEALLKILNVIPESIVPCFDNAKTSKEAWTILHQKYGGDEKSINNQNIEEIEVSMEAESSPSSPISGGSEFHVFLSFRGGDTRKHFTRHLYDDLEKHGISTFIDSEKLEKGEQIHKLLEYIKRSKICVPIFSKGYAESKWCLKEITESFKCGMNIIPVFYDVEPSDVRKQSGPFQYAFHLHESNMELKQEEVAKWREALKEVGGRSGFNLKDMNGDEAKLRRKIVDLVSTKVSKLPCVVAKHSIGLGTRIQDVKNILKQSIHPVRVVGIHGMGGIGKTTLAKAIYNDLAPQGFDGATCFLSDIREQSGRPDGLVKLQKQFLREVFKKKDKSISDVADRKSLIKDRANCKKVLLILDDVDSVKQIDALAGGRDWFGSGSVIIITTRDKEVLLSYNVKEEEIYEPQGLNEAQSLELFIRHAFHDQQPQGEYILLAEQVVRAAGGLPLTLEVLGSLLSSKKDVGKWKDILEKLKKVPAKEVVQILKISYTSLDDFEKQIFLDISCFFIGRYLQEATCMWEGCGWYPTTAIDKLEQRSLIKINKNSGKIEMHDQIRDMGREIVAEKSSRQLEKQSRHWNREDSVDLLRRRVGTKDVEAIYLDCFMDPAFVVDTKSFAEVSKLRLLLMDRVTLKGDYKHFPKELKWLECSLKEYSLPTSLHLENIIVLDLSYSSIVQFWGAKKVNLNLSWEMPVLEKLRVLKLKHCYRLKVCPDFRSMPHLQILDCQSCKKMSKLHPSIGHLQSLINLNLEDCSSLKELPKEVWQLTSLQELNLEGCRKITALPSPTGDCMSSQQSMLEKIKFLNLDYCFSLITCPNFMSMPHLEKLKLSCCGKIKEVDASISHLKSLIELDLSCCEALKELPQEIGQLTSLQQLDISYCSQISTLPESMGQLKQLKSLSLRGCSSLQSLPPLPPSFISLDAFGCGQLESIVDVSNAKGLQKLNLGMCERLVDIPGIEQLKWLKVLSLGGCIRLCDSFLARIMGLPGLESLDISYWCKITALPKSIISLENLNELLVNNCKGLKFLPQLPHSLTTLDASFCTELERIEGDSFSEGLRELNLTGCRKLVDILDIVQLKGVKRLEVGGCRSLQDSFLERLELFIFHLDKDYLKSYSIPGRVIKGGYSQSLSFLIPNWLMGNSNILLLGVDEKSLNRIGREVDRKWPWPFRRRQDSCVVRVLFSTDDAQIPFSASFQDGDQISDHGIPTATVKVRRRELSSPSKMMKMHVSIDGCLLLHAHFFSCHKATHYMPSDNIVKVYFGYD